MPKHAGCLLVVGEQASLRATIARLVVPLGYRVEIASSEKKARQLIAEGRFAGAVVAPAGLASRESAFVRELRRAVPILALIADDMNAAKRFAASFPDAVVCRSEPLEHEKLFAFLSESLSQTSNSVGTPEHLHFAGCTLDVTGRIFLNAEQQEVSLTRGEFALLVAFAHNCGRVLSRSQLRNAMGGGSTEAYDRSIDMLVARLRRKIEQNPSKPQFILAVPGVGYKFTPPVHRGQPTTAAPASRETGEVPGAGAAPCAERRQITVLCCQILGFAALAAKLDPEELDRATGPVYAACAEVIARFGGTVVRTLGDSMLAYFGYPKAHENDAARAVRAALELLRAINAMEGAPIGNFRARIGVATGLMLVGALRSIGSRDAGGIGEALNLALHMQKAAPPQGILIGAKTRHLVGRLFRCEEGEPVATEEESEPAPAWRVVEKTTGIPRFEALRRDGMLGFVGRDGQIERLRQCWSKAVGGAGQVVLLTGEAGIGKSRLAAELQEGLCGEPHAVIRYSGSPHCADAPMSVLIEELQCAAGFTPTDDAARKLEKLQSQFAALGEDMAAATALGCMLLGLPSCDSPQVNQMSPQRRKERTFVALLARIDALAARQPIFVVLEDTHWIDPTSLEFFALLVERASAMRLLLVIAARPEFAPPWPEYAHVTMLALPRLSPADSALLIEQVAGEHRISAAVKSAIIARADGVPLFVEELTKSVLESSANGAVSAASGSLTAATSSIPSTLQGLLLARFDRLDRGKAVAQAGAVIGREFSFELLRLIAGVDEPELIGALDELVRSGLAFRRGAPPQASYVFKHALVRDAAYGMLLRERRQMLHASVARAFEDHFPEAAEAQPELLAYHCREAGNMIKAVRYSLAAGEHAVRRSAAKQALAYFSQARELIETLPENGERFALEIELDTNLARALIPDHGYAAAQTRAAYRRARLQSEALNDETALPPIIHGEWVGAWSAADHQSALQEAQRLYAWGERNDEPAASAVAHVNFAMSLTVLGDLVRARRHLQQALRINQFVLPSRRPLLFSSTEPSRVSALSYLHYCLLLLGLPEQAAALAREVSALIPSQSYSRALAYIYMSRAYALERNADKLAEIGAVAARLSRELGYPYLIGASSVHLGWALAQRGNPEDGIEACQQGLAQLRSISVKSWLPFYLVLLAECYEQADDNARAMQCLAEAFEAADKTGERVWQAEIFRLKGRLLLHRRAGAAAAQACFVEALHTARQQKAKLLELRASINLAELLKHKHKWMQARAVLAPVYSSFKEGFEFIDLREAKTLLDTLFSAQPVCD